MQPKRPLDRNEMRLLPHSRNLGRPTSLMLCDNLRCGAPVSEKHPGVLAYIGNEGYCLCPECAEPVNFPGFTFSVSDAV